MISTGLVPYLRKLIAEGSRMKQLSLQMLFDITQASKTARQELQKADCFNFFVEMLGISNWQKNAIKAIATWVHSDDGMQVVPLLCEEQNLKMFIRFFQQISTRDFHREGISQEFEKILTRSSALCAALSVERLFASVLIKRMESAIEDAGALQSILKMLQLVFSNNSQPEKFIQDNNLLEILSQMLEKKVIREMVMVKPRVEKLYSQLKEY